MSSASSPRVFAVSLLFSSSLTRPCPSPRAKERELAEAKKQADDDKRKLRAELAKEAEDKVARLQQRVESLTSQ